MTSNGRQEAPRPRAPSQEASQNSKPATQLPEPVRCAVDAASSKKALDMVVLDLRGSGAFTDYFIVCSGQTTRQVRAIVDEVQKQLRGMDSRPSHVEGYQNAEWILLDYFDFIVHVFTQDTRRFYDLERLWGNATRIEFPS